MVVDELEHPLAWVAAAVLQAGQRRSPAWGEGERRQWHAFAGILQEDHFGDARDGSADSVDPLGGLRALGVLFGLNDLDLRLFAVALAPHVDTNIGLAFGLLTGRATAALPTAGLALELAGVGTVEAVGRDALTPAAPLRRHRLLTLRGEPAPELLRDLVVGDRVVQHLLGADGRDPSVTQLTTEILPWPSPVATQLAQALAQDIGLVWIRDRLGASGGPTAIAALADIQLPAVVADLRGRAISADLMDSLILESALAGTALVLLGADSVPRESWPALANAPSPVVAIGAGQWDIAWLQQIPLLLDAPALTGRDRVLLWRALTGDVVDVSGLAAVQLTPEEMLLAFRYAAAMSDNLQVEDVRRAIATLAGGSSRSGRRFGEPGTGSAASFDDLVVAPPVADELRRLIRWCRNRANVLARGPVHGVANKAPGLAALFAGPPGTGKTLAAHVVAGELGLELMHVDVSTVVDKYIGETEKNLERIFHEAESREVVLFFDEADALFGSRSEVKDARDRYANQEISYLLQRIEKFDGVTILTSNLRQNLDAAFTRRMQFIVSFGEPDRDTRVRLLEVLLRNAGPQDPDDPVDAAQIAAHADVTGGDLRNIVMAATYDAVSAGDLVGMRHVVAAAAREYIKLGRRVPAGLVR